MNALGGQAMAADQVILSRSKKPLLKRVAAYYRVSTKSQEQLDSLATQEQHYEELINENSSRQFAGIYSDVGNGTTVKERK